jgi:hypothetical protein
MAPARPSSPVTKWQIIHGNLGYSNKLNESVSTLIGQYLPKTVVLVLLGLVVSLVLGAISEHVGEAVTEIKPGRMPADFCHGLQRRL